MSCGNVANNTAFTAVGTWEYSGRDAQRQFHEPKKTIRHLAHYADDMILGEVTSRKHWERYFMKIRRGTRRSLSRCIGLWSESVWR